MSKTFTQKINKKIYKEGKRLAKIQATTAKINAKSDLASAKMKARQAKRMSNLESANPVKRKLAQRREISNKKHDVKMRKLESDAKLAELDPKLANERARAENKIKIEKSRMQTKTASATAYAAGAAALGRGLSDENNQDDRADRELELNKIRTIFGSNPNQTSDEGTGLKQGVE